MPFCVTEKNVTIYYDDAGTGHPLVFIHGWSFSGAVWLRQQNFFSSFYRCITPDLRGHGNSSAPPSGYTVTDLAADVTVLFERLELTGATLVGWSLGALVALSACSSLKDRLASLILVSGTPKFTASDDFDIGLPEKETRGLSLRLKKSTERTFLDFSRLMFAPDELSGMHAELTTGELFRTEKRPVLHAALQTLEALAVADVRGVLNAIGVPVLLVHGGMDRICRPENSRYMAASIPCAAVEMLEGAGHAPMLSRPDDFNRAVMQFLKGVYGNN